MPETLDEAIQRKKREESELNNNIQDIIRQTGFSEEEVLDRIKEKTKELKGLITQRGASFIVAKELGLKLRSENKAMKKFDEVANSELKIKDISVGMKNIVIEGTIKEKLGERTYTDKSGSESRFAKFILEDDTGEIEIMVWSMGLIETLRSLSPMLDIKIMNVYCKANTYKGVTKLQLHAGSYSKIEVI